MLLPRELVIDEALRLDIGYTNRKLTCPWCEASEHGFAITRTSFNQAAYFCHRASCGAKGYVSLVNSNTPNTSHERPSYRDRRNEFIKNLIHMPGSHSANIDHKYGLDVLTLAQNGARWAPDEDAGKGRLYLPIKSSSDRPVGCTLRTLDKSVVPKTRIYLEDPHAPLLSWYSGYSSNCVPLCVTVEGQLDAMKVSKVAHRAVSLLGSNFDEYKARDIQSVCTTRKLTPVLWMDPDAIEKAMAYKRKFEVILPNLLIVQSKADPKDMDVEDITKILQELVPK